MNKAERVISKDSVALLIDVQSVLFPLIDNNKELELYLKRIVKGFGFLDTPLVVTEQYSKGLGNTIEGLKAVVGEYQPIEKMSFSCFGCVPFIEKLEIMKRNTVILMGIEAHICVQQTAMDLIDRGFRVLLIEDCIGSRKANDKNIAVERMRGVGIEVTTYESILFELCEVSGTETFKKISRLIRGYED